MELKFLEKIKNGASTCRLCTKEGAIISIFNTLDSVRLFEQAMSCAKIQISPGDGLPDQVCGTCSHHLVESYRFKIQCEASDKSFRSLFSIHSKIEIEITPKVELTDISCDDNHNADDNFENNSDIRWPVDKLETSSSDPVQESKKSKRRSYCSKCQCLISSESNIAEIKPNGTSASSPEPSVTSDEIVCACIFPKARQKGRPPKKVKTRRPSEQQIDFKIESNREVAESTEAENKKAILRLRLDLFEDRLVGLEQALSLSSADTTVYTTPTIIKGHRNRRRRKSLQCTVCLKGYSSISHLQKHIQRGNCNIKSKILKVRKPRRIIKRRNNESSNDKSDIKAEENDDIVIGVESAKMDADMSRSHMCDQCGRTFKQRMVLQQHMHTHSDVKMYSCDLCGKRFTRKAHVVAHLRIHDNIKPYVCETCGRSFNKSSDLGRHRRIHSDARNFPCPLCGRGFKRSGDIASHMRSHTGDRPYKCVRCDKSYTTHSSLQKHRRAKCTADVGRTERTASGMESKAIPILPNDEIMQQTAYKIV